MTTTPQDTSRTAHLLALMKKGDDAFNARDFAAIEAAHHPDMTAHITGSAEPVYGRAAHAAAMQAAAQLLPRHPRALRPIPGPVRKRRLDHRRHQRHRNLHRADAPARRHRHSPDGQVVRRRVRPDRQVRGRPADHHLRLLGCRPPSPATRPGLASRCAWRRKAGATCAGPHCLPVPEVILCSTRGHYPGD